MQHASFDLDTEAALCSGSVACRMHRQEHAWLVPVCFRGGNASMGVCARCADAAGDAGAAAAVVGALLALDHLPLHGRMHRVWPLLWRAAQRSPCTHPGSAPGARSLPFLLLSSKLVNLVLQFHSQSPKHELGWPCTFQADQATGVQHYRRPGVAAAQVRRWRWQCRWWAHTGRCGR